jgi:tRNA dimethylallyltransferase
MLDSGLIKEVKGLLENQFTGEEKPLKSIGYKEVIQFLNNEIPDEDALLERIAISTRQLAKAQRTWFNKNQPQYRFDPRNQMNEIFETLENFLNSKQN